MINLMEKKQNELLEEFNSYVKEIYDNPEIGNVEYKTSRLLANVLIKYGFETKCPNLLETDFLGIYESKKQGPKLAYLCEYDALPEIGHGCGHNLIGVTSILAAIMLKEVIDNIGGSIYVFGCPAEENFGGKVQLAKLKAFDGCGHPEEGNSALDGVITTYQGISMLRQFIKPGCFIHGVITNGGKAANVIPEVATIDYYFRAPDIKYANYIKERAINIANGAALMHKLTVEHEIYECIYEDKKINYTLAKELKSIFKDMGIDASDVDEVPAGSSDVGAVSYQIPTIEGNMKICDSNVCGHSKEFALATISEEGKLALKNGSKALAILGYNLITKPELLIKVKEEFLSE